MQRLLGQARVLGAREAARLERGEALLPRAQLTRATCLTPAGIGALAIVGVVVLVATGSYQSIVASNAF